MRCGPARSVRPMTAFATFAGSSRRMKMPVGSEADTVSPPTRASPSTALIVCVLKVTRAWLPAAPSTV